jgi:diacylglycerol O-acyltransferase
VLDAWGGAVGDAASWVRRSPELLADPVGAARRAGELTAGLARLGRRLVFTPPSSIEGAIGPHRVWRHGSVELDVVKRIGRSLGGTVNDVVLAAITLGFRTLVSHRGEEPGSTVVRTMVPVSVRGPGGAGIPDNRVSTLLLELPIELEDPVDVFEVVRDRMHELKASHMAEAGEVVTELANLAPPPVVASVSRLGLAAQRLGTQRSVNTVTTNVPGPQFPLYCLGRELLEYLPFVPISHGVRIGTAILSYNGHVAFGVTGDYDSARDIGVLVEGILAGVGELDGR